MQIQDTRPLIDPALNARLGGAFVKELLSTYQNYLPLVLASYNANEKFAHTLWKRHIDDPFDVFAEEVTIRETRGYIKRVLKTLGIYRWLYDGAPPKTPIKLSLPPIVSHQAPPSTLQSAASSLPLKAKEGSQ